MKKAFTMLELVFVIIIIGILSVVLAPRMDDSSLQQAANQIISHIRHTQHLAMTENKFSNSDITWYKKRWQIHFSKVASSWRYVIFSDKSQAGGANSSDEVARNPENINQHLIGWDASSMTHTEKLNIGKSFGITNIQFSSTCNRAKTISFDNTGRPFQGDPKGYTNAYELGKYITGQCQITLTGNGDDIIIAIEPETGYVHQL